MTFLWPEMLWLLLLVPALVAVYLLLLRRKKKARAALREPRAGAGGAGRGPARSGGTCRRCCSCWRWR